MVDSKVIAFFIGLTVSVIIFIALTLSEVLPAGETLNITLLTFASTIVISYLTMKLFVFREIKEIGQMLDKMKLEDYSLKKIDIARINNPLILIKKEISDFAMQKQREIDELKKLETFRREFLADVSHELKTPVFAAQGFVHTLLDGAVNDLDVRDKFLEKAANSLDNLNVLIQDLITISQLEIGEIKMNHSNFDLRKQIQIVFDQLEGMAATRGTVLKVDQYSPKSVYIYADKNRIRQVLTNLISNAIKYGREKGTVTVYIRSQEDQSVKVYVRDNGPGIPPQHHKRIFERFYRVEKSRSKDMGGTGLGLAIVKHILEAHNSRIVIESQEGRGTTFSFKLKRGKVINEEG